MRKRGMFKCALNIVIVLAFLCLCCQGDIKKKTKKTSIMLLRVIPNTTVQLDFLKSLRQSKGGLKLQLWRHPDKVNRHVDVWISAKSYKEFKKTCEDIKLEFEIITKNIYDGVGKISMKNIERFDDYYQQYDELVAELKRLTLIYKSISTLELIGKSYEKRDIYSIRIHSSNSSADKPVFFLNCGSHAREWLAIAACKHVIRKILFDYKYDEEIKNVLKEFDIIMVPLLNPDGYVFSHEDKRYRLWRKSRSTTSQSQCRGADLNRNFDYRWGGGGSSPDPCEEIYGGTKPFSEKESLVLARYLYKLRRRLKSYLDVHTYGQLWMSPWGYTKAYPNHYTKQEYAMTKIKEAISQQKGGVRYKTGPSATTLYTTSGDSLDWVYGRLGVTYTFALELRPTLGYRDGFEYTRRGIVPCGGDLLTGIKTLAGVITEETNRNS